MMRIMKVNMMMIMNSDNDNNDEDVYGRHDGNLSQTCPWKSFWHQSLHTAPSSLSFWEFEDYSVIKMMRLSKMMMSMSMSMMMIVVLMMMMTCSISCCRSTWSHQPLPLPHCSGTSQAEAFRSVIVRVINVRYFSILQHLLWFTWFDLVSVRHLLEDISWYIFKD